jgi:hypothetical protein
LLTKSTSRFHGHSHEVADEESEENKKGNDDAGPPAKGIWFCVCGIHFCAVK